MTSGSDSTVKLWNIYQNGEIMYENIDYIENESKYLLCTLLHSSYVYCSEYFSEYSTSNKLIIASACFDSKVRIWIISLNLNGTFKDQGI